MEVDRAEASFDDEYWMVWFGDAATKCQQYVMIQLAKEFDEQDRALGMDAIYLEINDQSHSGYGLISNIQLGKDTVMLEFDALHAGLSVQSSPLHIRWANPWASFKQVQEQLASMARAVGIEVNEVTTV